MTIETYKAALKLFPWGDDYSDDFRVWKAWSLKKWELMSMQKRYDANYKLWNDIVPTEYKISVDK